MSALLDVRGLTIEYETTRGSHRAVDDVGFTLARGETLALVGESGSGKSTVALGLLRLIRRSSGRISGGSVIFDGRDLLKLPEREMQAVRGAGIGIIFQDPAMALNPVYPIGRQIAETIEVGDAAPDLRSQLHLGHVLKQNGHSGRAYLHDDLFQILGGACVTTCAHHVLGAGPLYQPAAYLIVGCTSRRDHVSDRNVIGGEPVGIDGDLILSLIAADRGDFGYSRHRLDGIA